MAYGQPRQAAPLRDRVVRGIQDSSTDSTDSSDGTHGKGTYKCWSESSMSQAIRAVSQGRVSVRRASELYSIPRSTLADRVSGRVLPGTKSGPPKILTDEEEEELVGFLCRLSDIGYPKSRQQVVDLVNQIAISRGREEISMSWWDSFRRRYSHLSLRTASTLSVARAKASDPKCIEQYFDILQETLHENGLMDSPERIYNMDETGMPLDPKAPKTIHPRGKKDTHSISSGNKVQITVVGCVSASGQSMPPMIIWDRKTLNPELAEGEIPGTLYGLSAKGWMDGVLFEKWFGSHFLRYIPASRPVLLLLDGHSSHFSPQAVELAAKEQIILFTLPPNTTHLTQPLDKGIFGPLKLAWRRICHGFLARNPGRVVTRYDFSSLFSEAWIDSMTPKNILAGFRTTGVHPLNRKVFDGDHQKASLAEKTGLRYIPLYTPSKSVVENEEEGLASEEHHHPCSRQRPLIKSLTISTPQHPKSKFPRAARVLTSRENLRIIREKEEEKQRKIKAKEERARQRLAKKATKGAKGNIDLDSNTTFTAEEILKFERRYENGFNILSDKRYNTWLRVHALTGPKEIAKIVQSPSPCLSSPLRSSTPSDSSISRRLEQSSVLLKEMSLSLSTNSMESDAECGAKECIIQGCNLQRVKWISCDTCATWLHKYCVGLEEIDDPAEFVCESCDNCQQSIATKNKSTETERGERAVVSARRGCTTQTSANSLASETERGERAVVSARKGCTTRTSANSLASETERGERAVVSARKGCTTRTSANSLATETERGERAVVSARKGSTTRTSANSLASETERGERAVVSARKGCTTRTSANSLASETERGERAVVSARRGRTTRTSANSLATETERGERAVVSARRDCTTRTSANSLATETERGERAVMSARRGCTTRTSANSLASETERGERAVVSARKGYTTRTCTRTGQKGKKQHH